MATIKIKCYEQSFGMYVGYQDVHVHDPEVCAGSACCIHNPSDHHMKDWEQRWRDDRKMMERMCPHEQGHPDPDDRSSFKGHGCDGCCYKP